MEQDQPYKELKKLKRRADPDEEIPSDLPTRRITRSVTRKLLEQDHSQSAPEAKKGLDASSPRKKSRSQNQKQMQKQQEQKQGEHPSAVMGNATNEPSSADGHPAILINNDAEASKSNSRRCQELEEALLREIPHMESNAFWNVTSDEDEGLRWKHPFFWDGLEPSAYKEIWERLDGHVSRLVVRLVTSLKGNVSWNDLGIDAQRKLDSFAHEARKFYEGTEDDRTNLISGWVWRVLYDNLFSPDCHDKWSGELWLAHGQIRQALRGKSFNTKVVPNLVSMLTSMWQERVGSVDTALSHQYHNWRKSSFHMLYMLLGSHSDPDRLKGIITREVAPMLGLESLSQSDYIIELFDTLVNEAISVDRLLEADKHHTQIFAQDPKTGKNSGFLFDAESGMEDVYPWLEGYNTYCCLPEDKVERIVRFVQTPALHLYGKDVAYRFGSMAADPLGIGVASYESQFLSTPLKVATLTEDEDPRFSDI